MFKDSVTLTGRLIIKKMNENNEVIYQTEVPNLVVTTGKNFIASRIVGETYSAMDHMAIGDDSSIVALAQSSLVNELSRVATSAATATGNTVTFNAVFPPGSGTGSIVEAGIFNDSSAGTMLCRTTFPVITKTSSQTISISWVVTVG